MCVRVRLFNSVCSIFWTQRPPRRRPIIHFDVCVSDKGCRRRVCYLDDRVVSVMWSGRLGRQGTAPLPSPPNNRYPFRIDGSSVPCRRRSPLFSSPDCFVVVSEHIWHPHTHTHSRTHTKIQFLIGKKKKFLNQNKQTFWGFIRSALGHVYASLAVRHIAHRRRWGSIKLCQSIQMKKKRNKIDINVPGND